MKKMRKMEDGGLLGGAKAALSGRQKVLDAAESAALGLRTQPPPVALAPKPAPPPIVAQNPNVLAEAQAKAAQFKFERENPGKTYVPPKMANGGYLPFRSQSPFIDSTTPPPQGVPSKPTPGLQNGMYSGYADGGEIGSFFGLPDHAKIATDTWALPKLATGYEHGGMIPPMFQQAGFRMSSPSMQMPTMGGYGGGNTSTLDPARAVMHTSGLRTMGKSGMFDSMDTPQKPWMPDTPEKQKMYMDAVAANQNAGSRIGGADIATAVGKQSNAPMTPMGWNNMADNMKMGAGGYPMVDGGVVDKPRNPTPAAAPLGGFPVGYANGGAVQTNGLRTTMMLSSGGGYEGTEDWPEAPHSLGHALGDGWRSGAIMSQSQTRITKFLQSYKDGGKVTTTLGAEKVSKPGVITGKGGPTEDKQPILASPGEFIIPADTTAKIGAENLQKLVDQTHEPSGAKGLRGDMKFGEGGKVPLWQLAMNKVGLGTKKVVEAAAGAGAVTKNIQDAATSAVTEFQKGYKDPSTIAWKENPSPQATSGRTPGWRSATHSPYGGGTPNPTAWSTAEGLTGPGGAGVRAPTPPPAPLTPGTMDYTSRVPPTGGYPKAGAWGTPFSETKLPAMAKSAAGVVGKTAGVLGKVAAVAAPVVEAANAVGDWNNPYLDKLNAGSNWAKGVQLASRAGLRLGFGGLGAAAGTAAGAFTGPGAVVASPVLAVAGGIGGYKYGEAVSDAANPELKLARNLQENEAFYTQKKAEVEARMKAKADAASEAPAVVPEAPAQAPQQADSGDSAYQDIMKAANAQAQGASAVPAMTTEDANQRARDTMASMDAANLQRDRLGMAQNDRMRNQTALTQAGWESRQANDELKRFKYDPGSRRDAAQKMALLGQAQQVNEGGIDRQAMAMEAPLARAQQTKMGELAAKTALQEHQMGLRGQMYGANVGLAGHMADRRLQYYQMMRQHQEQNRNDYATLMEKEFTEPVVGPDGKTTMQFNQPAYQEFEKHVTTQLASDPAFQKRYGTNRDLLTASDWRDIRQDYNKKIGLSKTAGIADRGMPTRVGVREATARDAFMPNFASNPVDTGDYGPLDWAGAKLQGAFYPNRLGNKVVEVGTATGRPKVVAGSKVEKSAQDVDQVIRALRSQGRDAEAAHYAELYNTTPGYFAGKK